MCAGLEMLLRNGVEVNKYLYQDVSEHSKRVAKVRCAEMVRQYPAQLRAGALSLETLPNDMKLTIRDTLIQQGALTGSESNLHDLLQQLQPLNPPAYIFENVSPLLVQQMNSRISKEVFPHIARIVGQPVSFDAAQLGSYTHRLRAYWSNLHDKAQSDSLMKSVERPPNRWVTDVIGEDGSPERCGTQTGFPHYRCNVVGKPMMALPTIMATQSSHTFRDDRAGTVVSKDGTGLIREVDLDEKARAMGYSADVLRRSGLSDMGLQVVLGLAMDRRAMEALYAVSEVTTTSVARTQVVHPTGRTISLKPFMKQEGEWVEVKQREPMQAWTAAWLCHSSKFAAVKSAAVEDCSWDGICQRLVKEAAKDRRGLGQKKPSPHAQAQRRRTWQLELWRPSQYEARARTTFEKGPVEDTHLPLEKVEGELYLITANAKEVRVPKPEDRLDLVKEYHERTGHWGCKRTEHLLCQKHWWSGIRGDMLKVVQQCETYGRVKTHYAKEEALLHPLNIKSFMYRWSLDLLKPGKVTPSGHRRILVMTEHYTRFVIAVPLPDKEASTIAWTFRNHVLSVFGAPAECLVDGGGEFEWEFEKLCESCLIDRRVTSPYSPEGNGLTERVVCTIKFCLKKCALVHALNFEWDQFLWAIVLSYNAAKQQSIGVAPFTMLFAHEPTVPPDLTGRPALEFDTRCRREMRTRESLTYWQGLRSKCGLETATKPAILRVVAVKDTGVVTLEGRTGVKEETTASHIAPCFLQIKDEYDFQEAVPGKHHACHVCKRSDNDSKMLLCDRCNKGYHLWCLQPKLKKVPDGEWRGPCCEDKPEAARAERRNSGDDSTDAAVLERWAGKLKRATSALLEKTPSPTTVLEFDVGLRRVILKGKAKQPWLAVSTRKSTIGVQRSGLT
ncbi:hypothetical protein CYMTET_30150 [Cymbomonas tetramitiformis]|uniref:Uncharacterized protein n=1 Tax=Cymbomonas tetramitiformis TaxID=36881 RepID=A0AAE0FJJ2_9CHLO|nr:hypothetical protein CYMTET_30150 [Cymbomonas tetramitiformis]